MEIVYHNTCKEQKQVTKKGDKKMMITAEELYMVEALEAEALEEAMASDKWDD